MLTNMKARKTIIAAVAALLAVSVASSRGQTLNLTGGTFEGDLTNQTLVNSGTGASEGTISTWVVKDSSLDSQGYIFIYQLENSGPDDITGVSLNDFGGSLATTPPSGSYSNIIGSVSLLVPTAVTPVTAHTAFTFNIVTSGGAATFDGDLPGGYSLSWFLVVYSDVNSFATGYALAQDNFQDHGDILAPMAAVYTVPEPSSMILLTSGILCFYAILRCRRAMS